jgi:CIC family chloride channel protein
MGPLFPVPAHPAFIGPGGLAGCVVAGLLAGGLSTLLTVAVYASEDAFAHVPTHWMWWPAMGGIVIGLGGLVFPQALGVGYDTIGALLQGEVSSRTILGILVVKAVIWSVALGSGTSGGVLAPLLMMGGALGGVEAWILPSEGVGFWPLVSMGAILGGTMRSPFTGIIFSLELTHDVNMLLPLLVAVTIAHAFTVLVLKRSILTEKVARRGYHLTREYAIDPLEILFAREVMRTNIAAIPADLPIDRLGESLRVDPVVGPQQLFPVVDADRRLQGVVTRFTLQQLAERHATDPTVGIDSIVHRMPAIAHPDEPLRFIVQRMADTGLTRFPVIDRGTSRRLVGMISLDDLLKARALNLEAERRRERTMRVQIAFPFRMRRPRDTP